MPAGATTGAAVGTVAMPLTSAIKSEVDTSRVPGALDIATANLLVFTRPGMTQVTTTITRAGTFRTAITTIMFRVIGTTTEQGTGTLIATRHL